MLTKVISDRSLDKYQNTGCRYYCTYYYNSFLVYYRELAPGTVSLTGDWAQGDDNKHDSHYRLVCKSLFIGCVLFSAAYIVVLQGRAEDLF